MILVVARLHTAKGGQAMSTVTTVVCLENEPLFTMIYKIDKVSSSCVIINIILVSYYNIVMKKKYNIVVCY